MLTAVDELRYLADTLTQAEAERVLAVIREHCPELYADDDDEPVMVTPPDPAADVP
jgi:hypothetical protein